MARSPETMLVCPIEASRPRIGPDYVTRSVGGGSMNSLKLRAITGDSANRHGPPDVQVCENRVRCLARSYR